MRRDYLYAIASDHHLLSFLRKSRLQLLSQFHLNLIHARYAFRKDTSREVGREEIERRLEAGGDSNVQRNHLASIVKVLDRQRLWMARDLRSSRVSNGAGSVCALLQEYGAECLGSYDRRRR